MQQELLRTAVRADDMETDVPATVAAQIVALKEALARTSDAVLSEAAPDASARSVEAALQGAMPPGTADVGVSAPRAPVRTVAGVYGGELAATVTALEPGLLMVQHRFSIECGDDNVLLVYSNASGRWKRVVRWQALAYDNISGAFGDVFEARLLRTRHNGNPVLLVVHGTPWCTSTMSGFAMDLLEVPRAAGAPVEKALWHVSHGYRRLDEPELKVKVTPDGFEVRASVNAQDMDLIQRPGIFRYTVSDAGVKRMEPLARNARDTVDEWVSMKPEDAAAFTDAADGSETWKVHRRLTWNDKTEEQLDLSLQYGAVRACGEAAGRFQAEINTTQYAKDNRSNRRGPEFFVQLREVPNGYLVVTASARADARCTGPDLMTSRSGKR